jgi:hypothetical protein
MLVDDQFDTLVLETVFNVIHKESLDTCTHLINLAHKSLLPCFGYGGNSGTCSCILLGDHISIFRPHVLENIIHICITILGSKTHHLNAFLLRLALPN